MPDDDFDFDDTDKGGEAELSLDDFFQPAGEGTPQKTGGKPKDSVVDDFFAPPGDDASALPVEKEKIDEIAPEEAPLPEPGLTPAKEPSASETAPAGAKGFFGKNWLLILIGVLVVLVVGAGSFLGYTILQKRTPDEPKVAVKDAKPADPKPAKPAAKPEPKPAVKPPADKPAPAPVKPPTEPAAVVTPPEKPGEPPLEPKPKKPEPTKPPEAIPPPEPEKKPEPAKKPAPRKGVPSTGGDFTVQVGAYMMPASKREVEARLHELGYQDLRYVQQYRRVKVYHVLAGDNLSREQAEQMMGKLADMGYHPELRTDGPGYRVLVYSYGSNSIARQTRQKVERAGVKPVKIEQETRELALDQLRVGSYASRSDANKALADLRRGGFKGAYVIKE